MESDDVHTRAGVFVEQDCGNLLGVDAELLRTAAHPHARTLDGEVGIDPDGDGRRDAEILAGGDHSIQFGRRFDLR